LRMRADVDEIGWLLQYRARGIDQTDVVRRFKISD
jgi:hypothetical protein